MHYSAKLPLAQPGDAELRRTSHQRPVQRTEWADRRKAEDLDRVAVSCKTYIRYCKPSFAASVKGSA